MQTLNPGATGFGTVSQFHVSLDKAAKGGQSERSLANNISASSQFAPSVSTAPDLERERLVGYAVEGGQPDQSCLGYCCCLPLRGVKALLEGCTCCIDRVLKLREPRTSAREQSSRGKYRPVQAQFEL